ncbi:unnamed protein product [Parnassius apollo]|uniref:(apollo) hypothetical protein n=3 Tax=Parnassius apollo TaxID=110799 RepID=A0A8S3WD16_PARAO|nr:unnamed protein product [Parnassius apollo]
MVSAGSSRTRQAAPAAGGVRRMRWTRDMNANALRAYYRAKGGETAGIAYRARMHRFFTELEPSITVTEQNLADRVRYILRSNIFDGAELERLRREAVPSSNENATTEGAVPQVAEQPAHVDAAENTPVVADSNDDGTFTQELEIEQMRSTLEEAIMETRSTPLENRPRLPRIALSKRNRAVVRALNPMLVTYLEASRDLCETDSILFGAALAVCRIIGAKLSTAGRTTGQSSAIPAWRTRIEERIARARALIGRLICFRSGNTRPRIVRTVRMAFAGTNVSLSQPDIMQKLTERIDDLKQRIAAWGKRIRRYTERSTRFNQNRLFQSDQKRLYKSLERPMVSGTGPVPNQADTVAFWRSLWSEPVNHNEGPWTEVVASQCAGITPMDPVTITPDDVAEAVRRAPNWKSPGLDGLHHYWLKGFVVCHTVLARQFQEVLNQKSLPSLFTTGITHLVPKGQGPLPGGRRGASGAGAGRGSMRAASRARGAARSPNSPPHPSSPPDGLMSAGSSRTRQAASAAGGVRRMRWTRDMNANALRAYYRAKGEETAGIAYRARMHCFFAELEPSIPVTEQNLADRVRYIMRSKIFDDAELERLRREAIPSSNELATAGDEAPQATDQLPRVEAAMDLPVVGDSDDDEMDSHELEQMRSILEEAILETRSMPLENRPRLPRIPLSKRNRAVVRALNPMLVTYLEASRDLCETDSVLFGAAVAACRIIGAKFPMAGRATKQSSAIPAWRKRIEDRIAKARALIGRLISFRSGNNRPRVVRTVSMAFAGTNISLSQPDITQKLTERIDDLKQKIAAWGKRIRRFTESSRRFNQNRLFQSDQKRLYKSLERPEVCGAGPGPDQANTVAFWRGLWSEPVNHSEGPWTEVVASQCASITPMDPVIITPDDVAEAVRRAPNWKSPGLDGLHHYWLKGFMVCHAVLARQFQEALNQKSLPSLFTTGITHLVPKDQQSAPATGGVRRMRWTTQMNSNALRAYFRAKGGETVSFAYRARIHRLFAELEPSVTLTEQNLADRVRYILRSYTFDVAELERLRREDVPSSGENAAAEDAAPQLAEQTANVDAAVNTPVVVDSNDDGTVAQELKLEQMRSKLEEAIVETRSTPLENRPRLPRLALSKRKRAVVRALNPMLVTYLEARRDLCETDSILFGAALAVCRIIGVKLSTAGRATGQSSAIPAWRIRIEERIARTRALIGRLICFRSGNTSPRIVRTVRMAFAGTNVSLSQPDITQKLTERIDDLKQRIAAWGKRIRRYTERSTRFNQNRLFQSDQKRLYKSLERPIISGTGPAPNQADTVAFWRSLWSEPVNHNEGLWTEVVASQCAGITPMDPVVITPDDVAEAVRRAPNWKSPGLDGLHHYWLKGFMPDITQKLTERIDDLKQKIAAWGKRIRRFSETSRRFNQNRLFQSDQKRLYKSLERPEVCGACPGLDQADTVAFWRRQWSEPVNHSEGPWMEVVASQSASVTPMDPVTITPEDVAEAVRRAPNWKSPGLDGLHRYWLKGFIVCHAVLARQFQEALDQKSLPSLFTTGITHLVPNDQDTTDPSKYRPITAKGGETVSFAYRARIHRLFAELEPSVTLTEQNLADRVRYILRSNTFDVTELERLRREDVPSSGENAAAEDAAPQLAEQTANVDAAVNTPVVVDSNDDGTVAQELKLEQMRSKLEEAIVETRSTPLENRPRLPRLALSKRNRAVVRALNPMLVTYLEARRDLCETDSILFGAALAVCRIISVKLSTAGRATGQSSAIPAWRIRIEERIARARALIGRLICFRSGNTSPRIVRTVGMAFAGTNVSLSQPDITQKLTERIDDLKQRIAAWGKRIRRYTERSTRFNQNRLFQSDQKRLYKSLERPIISGTGPAPNQAEPVAFWCSLWSEPVNHNEGPWTEVVASQFAGITPMDPIVITPDDVAEAVRRAPELEKSGA